MMEFQLIVIYVRLYGKSTYPIFIITTISVSNCARFVVSIINLKINSVTSENLYTLYVCMYTYVVFTMCYLLRTT